MIKGRLDSKLYRLVRVLVLVEFASQHKGLFSPFGLSYMIVYLAVCCIEKQKLM